ncbi:MAG TPA: endonuclease/exonuclease/phosphatase family protein [Candidatus Binataceae bacterium]
MKFLEWNINHRARQKPIPSTMASAILSLGPDVAVLTEYVSSSSRGPFLDELASGGLTHQLVSAVTKGENQILIAARGILEKGEIRAPAIAPSLPSNVLHVRLPTQGFEVLGLRVPDYSKQPPIRRACWDWLTQTARTLVSRPFVLIGDFNTDPSYAKARCGPRIAELVACGWQHAAPSEGASYWTPKGHAVRIDHAFVSGHFAIMSARYVREGGQHVFAGGRGRALSDHAALIVDLQWNKENAPPVTSQQ